MKKSTYFSKKIINYVLIFLCMLCTVLLILNSVLFIDAAFTKLPQADDWRLTIFHLMPWYEGGWTFSSLWGDVHPNPIHSLVLIFSAEFEALSFDSLPYVIISAMVVKWVGYYCSLTAFSENTKKQKVLLLFCTALVVFSFNSTMQFRWNSVGIAQIYHAIGAVYLIALLYFLHSPKTIKSICFVFVAALVFQLISRQYSVVWLVSSLIVLVIFFATQKGKDERRLFKFFIVFVLVFTVEYLFHQLIGTELRSSSKSSLASFYGAWAHRPVDIIKYLLVAISSPFINPRLLQLNFNLTEEQIILISLFVAVLYFMAIIICIKNLRTFQYQIALIMIGFTVITIFAGLVYRTTAETHWMQAHVTRYVSFRDVSILAILWVFIKQSFRTRLFVGFSSVLLVILVGMQMHYIRYNWNYLKYLKNYNETLRQQLLYVGEYLDANPDANPKQISLHYEQQYRKKLLMNLGKPVKHNNQIQIIKFWKKHKLNLYRLE